MGRVGLTLKFNPLFFLSSRILAHPSKESSSIAFFLDSVVNPGVHDVHFSGGFRTRFTTGYIWEEIFGTEALPHERLAIVLDSLRCASDFLYPHGIHGRNGQGGESW